MKTACIYHQRDLDGYCSAAVVKKWTEESEPKKEIIFIGYDYGRPLPDLREYSMVIMCDISFPGTDMLALCKAEKYVIWCDHHISAITEVEKVFKEANHPLPKGLRDTNFAACELTWKYFNIPEVKGTGETFTMPMTVKLLGEYDSWRNKDMVRWEQMIMPFQWGMRMICNSFETFPMRLLNVMEPGALMPQINEILENGEIILKYQNQSNEGLCRLTFAKKFKGLRAICLNASGTGSQTFKSVWDQSKYDIMITFYYNGHHDFFTVSLYSDKDWVDCSVLAKELGGGGHKGAAGFQVKDFREIWEK